MDDQKDPSDGEFKLSDQSAEYPHHEHVEATKQILEADTLFFQDVHPTIPPPPYIKSPFSRPRRPLPPSQLPTDSQRLTQTHFSHKEFKLNPREYLEQGEYVGEIFTPKDIRNILTASGYFVQEQIKAWRTYVVVPPGMNAVDYIIVKAAREGLTLLGMYDDGRVVSPANDLSEDELIALNTRNGLRQKTAYAFSRQGIVAVTPAPEYPPTISDHVQQFYTKSFSFHLNPIYPSTIHSWIAPWARSRHTEADLLLSQFKRTTGRNDLLYRGVSDYFRFADTLVSGPRVPVNAGGDFGFGIYYTPSYSLARVYATAQGIILAYDVSEGFASHTVKELGGEEWERTVKWYLSRWRISIGDVVENMEIEEEVDFACGPVTSSVQRQLVEDCHTAIPTAARQVCAKTQAAVNYMAPRLVAIICMS